MNIGGVIQLREAERQAYLEAQAAALTAYNAAAQTLTDMHLLAVEQLRAAHPELEEWDFSIILTGQLVVTSRRVRGG